MQGGPRRPTPSTGYFVSTFAQPLFGIPATGKTLYLRYRNGFCTQDGQIIESYLIPDFIDAMSQAGVKSLRKKPRSPWINPYPSNSRRNTDR
ncbi:hypothetical protein O9992_27225 [Vibrio lentus]|nr:hypothetical protein [Vibrio lentus]